MSTRRINLDHANANTNTTVVVKADTHAKLKSLLRKMMAKLDRDVTMDELIAHLCNINNQPDSNIVTPLVR